MQHQDLNQFLNCLFTLVVAYLNLDQEAARHGACQSTRSFDEGVLATLRSYGLVEYSDAGNHLSITAEGEREAMGALKYLQLALGPSMGASHDEIRCAWPRLFADEAAAGAGPLTTSEFVAAVRESGRLSPEPRPSFSPTALLDPPASYHRDAQDARSLLMRLELKLGKGTPQRYHFSNYYGYPPSGGYDRTCWRKVLVPAGLTFLDLHLIIQRCLCWKDLRPFGFLLSNSKGNLLIGERGTFGGIPLPKTRRKKFLERRASELRLGEVFPRTQDATYSYGDGTPWEVIVTVLEAHEGISGMGPQLVDGVGDAPPEWVVGAEGFDAFENELYGSSRNVIRALSRADATGFFPFNIEVARERLSGFEDDRARWQAVLDGQAEKNEPEPPGADPDDDLSRFDGYKCCEDPEDEGYEDYADYDDIPV